MTNVFYVDHWITVTQNGQADWNELKRALATPIREAPAADAQSEQMMQDAEANFDPSKMSEAERARLDKINEILDEEIRPFLQNDGGDLYVVGLEGNKLSVH